MFPYSIQEYVVRCKLTEDENRGHDGDNEERRKSLHESKYQRSKNMINQIDCLTIPDSSSEPVTPFHKTITIVNINVSQSSSRRPPSSE